MTHRRLPSTLSRLFFISLTASIALFITACNNKKESSESATQAAAKVNDSELTVHEINRVLERRANMSPTEVESATKQVLEALIDQELAVQKAEESKLDRDPKVAQLLAATRKAVLARQYLEKAANAGISPNLPTDIQKYFDENPGLFSNRRTYLLQEFSIEADETQVRDIQSKLSATSNTKEFVEVVRNSGLKVSANQVTQPAESLPLNLVGRISALKDGQAIYEPVEGGLKAVLVVASKPEPLTLEQAKPLIDRFLTDTKRTEWLKNHVKELRKDAKVQYFGKFQAPPPEAAASSPGKASPQAIAASALGG